MNACGSVSPGRLASGSVTEAAGPQVAATCGSLSAGSSVMKVTTISVPSVAASGNATALPGAGRYETCAPALFGPW
ncbi:MAG: hypothetical protein QM765_22460 [Myxococcales bacterium]